MSYPPTTNPGFLATLENWFRSHPEILILIRYSHAAGARDFEFYRSLQQLSERLRELPHRACVTAFRQPQLPIRGVVDDEFISKCLASLPDGSEYLVVHTEKWTHGSRSWFHHDAGASHAELRDDLEESRGASVAAGPHPEWLEDNENVISAVVPDEDGVVRCGVY